MKTVFLYFTVLLVNFNLIYGKGFRCDYTYHKDGFGWFKLHLEPEQFEDAEDICKMEGAVIASAAESWVRDVMLKILVQNGTDKVFTTSTPGGSGKDTEVFLKSNSIVVEKGTENPFICYFKGSETVSLNDCGSTDNDYQLFATTNNCYKFHTTARTWQKAFRTCKAEGGYLAVVNSVDEVKYLTDVQYTWVDKVFMGFSANPAGKWLTASEPPQSLLAAGYTFGPGQPVDAFGSKVCGALGRDQQLYNTECNIPMQFYCEKDPNSLTCDPPTTTSTTTTTTTTTTRRPPPPPPPPVYYPPPPPPPVYYPPPPPPVFYPPPPPPPQYSSQDALRSESLLILIITVLTVVLIN